MTQPLRIKICGITSADDARAAALAGADAIGLNFHPASPRYLEAAAVSAILGALPPLVEPVAVCTDLQRFLAASLQYGMRTLQWHGDPALLTAAPPVAVQRCCLIVALAVGDQASLERIPGMLRLARELGWAPRALLVDGFQRGLLGGTGHTAPWEQLAGFDPGVPLILAGGLTPDNVALAVRIVRPWGVDVASGVESSPGKKEVDKMRRFIHNARSAI